LVRKEERGKKNVLQGEVEKKKRLAKRDASSKGRLFARWVKGTMTNDQKKRRTGRDGQGGVQTNHKNGAQGKLKAKVAGEKTQD